MNKDSPIKVASKSFSRNKILRAELLSHFPNVVFNDNGLNFDQNSFSNFIAESSAIIVGLEPINEAILKHCPKLEFISKFGVGLDNINEDAIKKYNVALGWSGGLNCRSVAEMVLCYMIGLSRNIFFSSRRLVFGNDWSKEGGEDLSSKIIGIIGVGFIGKDVIKLLSPFGCIIMVNDIVDQSDFYNDNGLVVSSKADIFEKCDIISIHTPLDNTTRGFFNKEVFQKMKKDSYFINCARGGLVIESDLKIALQKGYIAGAAIDVFDAEPSDNLELIQLPNMICTPHTGGSSSQAVLAMGRSAISHLVAHYEGY